MAEMEKKYHELKARLQEINDIESAGSVLHWDMLTHMPPGGAEARGRQMATLELIAKGKSVDPALGRLLDDLEPYGESLPYDSDQASLIRVARRDYERAIKIPPAFSAEFDEHSSRCYMAWAEARPANDFKKVQPLLEKTLDYSRQLANFFPGYAHIADPLIDFDDYGMKAASLSQLFQELRQQLVPIVKVITSQPEADEASLRKHFPEAQQLKFAADVVRRLGYDFNRGRIDKTHHPFCTGFSIGDVRIATRVKENYLAEVLFSNIHEAGHAMYEQGMDPALEGTLLLDTPSAGVDESQSGLWENVVGRSRSFWEYFFPKLQAEFPDQLKGVSLEAFYRSINKVARTLIRTDADEVTYNLHIMLRFDLELQLLEGKLAVGDLPEAWRECFTRDIGITPPDDKDGVLQDVHWYGGQIGGTFQGYTLGRILSVQFYQAALKQHPHIPGEMKQGKFDTLRTWLAEHIYRHGRKFTTPEIVERVTGGPLTIGPYIEYLKNKYGELYTL